MSPVDKRVKKGGRTAAAMASEVGKKAAKRVALAADTMLMKLGDAAKRRQRARRTRAALKTAGKVALVVGAGAVTAIAGRRVLARVNGRGRKGR
jgi:hypothetical protein